MGHTSTALWFARSHVYVRRFDICYIAQSNVVEATNNPTFRYIRTMSRPQSAAYSDITYGGSNQDYSTSYASTDVSTRRRSAVGLNAAYKQQIALMYLIASCYSVHLLSICF